MQDIHMDSTDISAHNLTVNRKLVTLISILCEHRAGAAFVYTITLLKAVTLSKDKKKK